MALPVDVDYPIVDIGPYQYDHVLPDIAFQLKSVLNAYRRELIIEVLNRLREKRQLNKSRMFLYNMCVANQFQNAFLSELLAFCSDYIELQYYKNPQAHMRDLIGPSVETILTVVTSLMSLRYKDLQSQLTDKALHLARQNLNAYQEILSELKSLYPNYEPKFETFCDLEGKDMPFQNQQVQLIQVVDPRTNQVVQVPAQWNPQTNSWIPIQTNVSQQPPQNYSQPQFDGYGRPINPMQMQPMPLNRGYGPSTAGGIYMPQTGSSEGPPPLGSQSDHFGGSRAYRNDPTPAMSINLGLSSQTQDAVRYKEADWKASEKQPYLQLVNLDLCEQAFKKEDNDVVQRLDYINSFERALEITMERSRHLLGKREEAQISRAKLREDVAVLEEIKRDDIAAAIENPDAVYTRITEEFKLAILTGTSLIEAINETQLQHSEKQAKVYRARANIFKPLFNIQQYQEEIRKLANCVNFPELVLKLREISDNPRSSEQDRIFVKVIDDYLTTVMNEFIQHNLSLPTEIDSFKDDILSLEGYLRNKYSARYSQAFSIYEERVCNILFYSHGEDIEHNLRQNLSDDDENVNTGITFLPENILITTVKAFTEELFGQVKFKVEDKYAKLISPEQHPLLYVIAKTSFDQTNDADFEPLKNYLILQDRQMYQIYQGYIGEDAYLIRKVELQ